MGQETQSAVVVLVGTGGDWYRAALRRHAAKKRRHVLRPQAPSRDQTATVIESRDLDICLPLLSPTALNPRLNSPSRFVKPLVPQPQDFLLIPSPHRVPVIQHHL